ncbi:MAG: hypothetical protein AB1847_20895 [bacterium]
MNNPLISNEDIARMQALRAKLRRCRVCGCTDSDCRQGHPCW